MPGWRQNYVAEISSKKYIPGLYTSLDILDHFFKWTSEELKRMDQTTRKLMTMHKALYPRDNGDRLYVSRKEGGRGLASIEDSVGASIQ